MHRSIPVLCALVALAAAPASAASRKPRHDEGLGKKSKVALDTSLAGNITRKKSTEKPIPVLQYDQFRLGVELQVESKRKEQISSLKQIIQLSNDPKEMPGLLFRLGDLYFEESRYYFFEANRQDDAYARALDAHDSAAAAAAQAKKKQLTDTSNQYSKLAIEQYARIVQRYRDFPRMDQVLYFLGKNLMDDGQNRKALVVYERLITKYPQSKFIPDAFLAFGEYFFNSSKGRPDMIARALKAYQRAAANPQSHVYAFALYKEGWCYFNLVDFQKAMDEFKSVVLYGQLLVATGGNKAGKTALVRQARHDFVRAYAHIGTPMGAEAAFKPLTSKPEQLEKMLVQLANLYYDHGNDKYAALMFNTLIQRHPLSPEAPGYQAKIVDCVLRAGNKAMTVRQVRRLVKIIDTVEASPVAKTPKAQRELKKARDFSERTLSNLAVNWHKEGKKTRDPDTFRYADEVYGDYLKLFPNNPKAYDLRFFWAELLHDNLNDYARAAVEYSKVMDHDIALIEAHKKPGKWLDDVAYDAVLSYNQVVKDGEAAGKISKQATGTKPAAIPKEKAALLNACERYMKYLPKGKERVEIEYKAANVLYRYNHFDKAVKLFADIALHHPGYKFENGDSAGEIAANLILDSFNLIHDYAKLNAWARRFYQIPALAKGDFRKQLAQVIEASSFKLVADLEQKQEFDRAARAYLDFLSDFPKTTIADKALYDASVDFYKAHEVDQAIAARNRLIRTQPESTFVPECIYSNAEAYEALGQFDASANAYEAYVRGWVKAHPSHAEPPRRHRRRRRHHRRRARVAKSDSSSQQIWDEAKAQVALYDAGIFREVLGHTRAALRDRQQFLELWPNAKDADKVFLSIADLYEKAGHYTLAAKQIEAYERQHEGHPNEVLYGEGRLWKIYAKEMHRARTAQGVLKRVSKYYAKLPGRYRRRLDPAAREVVGRAENLENASQFAYYAHMKLRWGRMPKPMRGFKESLKKKALSLKQVQRLYTKTVKLEAADPAICALYMIGRAYDDFADKLIHAPMPRGAPPDLRAALRDQFAKQAEPSQQKALTAYAAAANKARQLWISNPCAEKAMRALRKASAEGALAKLDAQSVPLKISIQAPAKPRGFLTEIVPVRTAKLLQATQAAAAVVQEKPRPSAPAETVANAGAASNPREDAADDRPPAPGESDSDASTPSTATAPATSKKGSNKPSEPADLNAEPKDNL